MEKEIEVYIPMSINDSVKTLQSVVDSIKLIKDTWEIFMFLFDVKTKEEADKTITLIKDIEITNIRRQKVLIKCRPEIAVYMQDKLPQNNIFFIDIIGGNDFEKIDEVNISQIFTIDFWLDSSTYLDIIKTYLKLYEKKIKLNINFKLYKPMPSSDIDNIVTLLTPIINKHYRFISNITHTRSNTEVMTVKGFRNIEVATRKYIIDIKNVLAIELFAPNKWQLAVSNNIYKFNSLHSWSTSQVIELLTGKISLNDEPTYFYGKNENCVSCPCNCQELFNIKNKKQFDASPLYCAEMYFAKKIDEVLKSNPEPTGKELSEFIYQI